MHRGGLRAINLSVRLAALASKLGVVLAMAIFLETREVAVYGIIVSVVLFCVYAVGVDYYTYANRELVGTPPARRGIVIRSQLVVSAVAYVVVVLVALGAWAASLLPLEIILWSLPLLVIEHQAQEVNRILIALDDQLMASVIMFIRSGLWGLVAIAAFILFEEARSLSFVLTAWITCSAFGAVLGFARLGRLRVFAGIRGRASAPLIHGLRIASPFFVGTLAVQAMFMLDRFLVGELVSAEALAAYTVFITIAGALRSVLDAGVFAFSLPRMLRAGSTNDLITLRSVLRRATLETAVICLVAFTASYLLGQVLVTIVLGETYSSYFWMLPLAVVAVALFCLGTPPQQALYSRQRDGVILASNCIGLLVFVGLAIWLPGDTAFSILIGLVAGFGIATITKFFAVKGIFAASASASASASARAPSAN